MKHRLLSLLVACCMAMSGFSDVTYLLEESFESGIPETWEQEVVLADEGGAWIAEGEDLQYPTGAKAGDWRVALRATNYEQSCVRLITPALNLAGVYNPQLTFAHAQALRGSYSDTLSVYYRVSSTDAWVSLKKYGTYQDEWSVEKIELPAQCCVNGCQIAFEGKLHGAAWGVVLDDVRIFPASQCVDANFAEFYVGANSADIAWDERTGRTFELIVSATEINPSSFDPASAVFYADDLTGDAVTVEGLNPTTKYYVYLRTDCDDNESGHTNWISTSFTTAIGVPYAPVLSALPSTWKRYTGPTTVSVNESELTSATSAWTATTSTTVLGVGHLYANPTTKAYWATTPAIDLTVDDNANIAASFDLAYTGSSTSASASSAVGAAKFHVYVATADGDTWTLERTIKGTNLSNTGRTFHVMLDAYKGTSIRLAFVAEGVSTDGYMHFGNLHVNEIDPSCLGILDLIASATSNAVNLSWAVTGTNTNAVAVISTSATFADTLDIQNVSAAAASFTGLNPQTTYYVSVRQDCEAGNTLTATVKTPCLPLEVSKENPWSENFDGMTAGDFAADCWRNEHIVGESTSVFKISTSTSSSTVGSNTTPKLQLPDMKSGTITLLALPGMTIDQANAYLFKLDVYRNGGSSVNAEEGLRIYAANVQNVDASAVELGFIPRNFTVAGTNVPAEAASDWYTYEFTIPMSGTVYILVQGESKYSSATYLDNLEVSKIPDCLKVKDVAVGAITGSSAEVSFTENGAAQYEVLVVNQPMNPDTLNTESLVAYRGTATASPAAVSDLMLATKYYAYVRALCSEENGAWSSAASFTTECGVMTITQATPWTEDFESYASGEFDGLCWFNKHTAGTGTSRFKIYTSTNGSNSTHQLQLPDMKDSTMTLLGLPMLKVEEADAYTFALDVYRSSSTYGDHPGEEGIRIFASLSDTIDNSAVEMAFIPRLYTASSTTVPAVSSTGWYRYEFAIPVAGNSVRILLQGESKWASSTYMDNFQLTKLPTCRPASGLTITNTTANSATLSFNNVNSAQQYQILVATVAIDPATANLSSDTIVYNEMVSATSASISNLESNSRYYIYLRSYCGDEDYSAWTDGLSFKTLCAAVTPAAFGVETFTDRDAMDCWTIGFTHPGTSTSSAYAQRDSVKAYGAYLKLSKESVAYTKNAAGVDTVYSDGAYAISPMLDVDDISNYQVSFMAATFNNTATTNYKRLNIGIITNPSDLSPEILKTIELDYAADSTALKSYTVSFTDYEGDYLGEMGKYVIFQLNEPTKRDSTNFVLIDNVSFELASSCQQILEAKMDSVGVEGAKISWENTGASEYEVMLASINSLRPDTISNPIDTKQVSTTAAELDALTGNTIYYAYVRGICGEDTAKWSNSIRFRTSIGIPYDEPFSTTTLSDGWQSLYGKFSGDTILTSALTTPTGDYKWSIVSASLPTGMTAPAAYGYIYDYTTGDPWLISPAIDLRGHENDNIELTVDLARSITAETDASFFVIISEDGGLTWAKANATTWSPSGGDYGINELPTTATNFTISLTKYAGKKIALAFYLHATNGYKKNYHGIYVDNISVHTFEAVCRGLANVSVAAAADSAKVMWTIEGTPAKAAVEIYSDATFTTRLDSVGVEDAYEHTFTGLTPQTTYYVRAKQLDCEDAEWKSAVFTTKCMPVATLPIVEDFEDYTGVAYNEDGVMPDCWIAAGDASVLPHVIGGSGSYVFKHSGSNALTFYGSGNCYAVLPAVEAELNTLQISFWMQTESASYGKLTLGYITEDDVDMNTFTPIEVYANNSGSMIERETSLAAISDSAKYLVFHWNYSSQWSCCIDDVVLDLIPECPKATGLGVDSIVADSARLFVADLGARGYEFIVATAELNLLAMTAADSANIIFNDSIIGDTAMFVTNLNPVTSYYVYARALCDEGKMGAWSAAKSFVSACAVITVAEGQPWSENFNSMTTEDPIPSCWQNGLGTATYPWEPYASGHEGKCMSFDSYYNNDATTDTLVTPAIYLSSDAILSFWWKNSYGGNGYVLISADGGATKTTLKSGMTSVYSWTENEVDLAAYTGQTVNLYFVGTSNYSDYSGAALMLDDVKVRAIPSCLPVEGVRIDSIGVDSAYVFFRQADNATYDVAVAKAALDMYHLTAADSAKIVFSVDATADTAHLVAGLTPATAYYVYVRTHCDATSMSEWTDVVSFTTSCREIIIGEEGWAESFDDLTSGIPACWDNSEGTTTSASYKWSYYSTGYDGVGLRFNSFSNTSGYTNILATPTFILTKAMDISFWWKNPAGGAGEVLIAANGGSRVTLVTDLTGVAEWTKYEIDLSAYMGDTVVLYFKGTSNYAYGDAYLYLDDLTFVAQPDCRRVPGVAVDSIEQTTAQLTFTKTEAPLYDVLVALQSINPDTLTSDSLIAFRDTVALDTVQIDGLSASTSYVAYVRALCGDNERGPWSDAVSFFTACGQIVVGPAGWSEDFENFQTGSGTSTAVAAPNCWASLNAINGPYAYVNGESSYNYIGSGSQYLFFNGSSGSTSKYAHFILPEFAALNTLQIRFKYAFEGSSSGDIVVGYMTDITNQSTFHAIETVSHSGITAKTAYQTEWIGLDAIPDADLANARLALRYTGTSYWYANVDDIELSLLPACPASKHLAAAELTATSAKIVFTKTPSPEYDLIVTLAAIDPDTVALVADSIILLHDTVLTDSVALTALTPATDYYVYVRGICSDTEVSEWTAAQFTTLCLVSLPYSENFDDTADRKAVYEGTSSYTIPSCWNEGYSSKTYVSYIQDNATSATYAYSGTSALRLYSTSSDSSYVVLPELEGVSLDTLQLTFKARAMYMGSSSYTNYASSTYAHSVKVGTLTDPNDFSTFQLLDTYVLEEVASPASSDDYWEDATIFLQGATGKFIALVSNFSKSNYVWIDDVEISRAPDCVAPSGIAVSATFNAADVTWNSSASAFEVALCQAGVLPINADSIYAVENVTNLHIEDLTPSTDYDLYVRAVCSENLTSDWSKVTRFTTSFGDNWDDDFESANTWTLINGSNTNAWAWGEAVANGGTHALYISDDDGANHAYTNNSAAMVYAVKLLDFEDGKYQFTYDWLANGESTYDYLRVALVPASVTLTAGTSVPSGFSASGLPTGWIALDGGSKLNLSEEWQTKSVAVRVSAGAYYVVLAWRDDTNGGSNPPAAVDNFSIAKLACGYDVENLAVAATPAITTSTAAIQWKHNANVAEWQVVYASDAAFSADKTDTLVVDTAYAALSGLHASTTYYVKVRALCSAEEVGGWSNAISFTTSCEVIEVGDAGWFESFNDLTSGIPACWDNAEGTTTSASSKWSYYSTGYDGVGLRFNSYSNTEGYTNILATPELALTKGMELSFWWKNPTGGNAEVLIAANGGSRVTLVTDLTGVAEWTKYEIDLSDYTGDTVVIYFKGTSNYGNGDAYLYLDEVAVAPLPDCRAVRDLSVSNISMSGAQINFRFAADQTQEAQVAISREAAYDAATVLAEATTTDTFYYFNVALEDKATYYIYVRQVCGEDQFSAWKSISFATPYMIRYEAEFEAAGTLPEDWNLYTGNVNNVLAGTTRLSETTYGWSVVAADTVLNAVHFRGNIYGTSFNNWAVSPAISLSADADANVQLRFDAGLTPYSSSSASSRNTGTDDRFIILISTDNGNSWIKLREWNNSGSQDVYNSIPENAKTYYVDLSAYIGQTVKVAFYGESTASNADNYFHFGNIIINQTYAESFTGSVCQGSNYVGANDGNTFYITKDMYQVGENTYREYRPAANGSGLPDSVFTLTLTVNPTFQYETQASVCEGESVHIEYMGAVFDFVARKSMNDPVRWVDNEFGCQDEVILHLTVFSKVEEHIYDSVALGEQYEWHGEIYVSATDARFDTLSMVTGCDSTVYLHLSVYQKEEALHGVHAQDLLIAPNPVHVGEPIRVLNDFLAEDLKEARIEIYSTTGALYYVQHGADQPFILPAIEVSGMYYVRVLIDDQIYLSTLLVQ